MADGARRGSLVLIAAILVLGLGGAIVVFGVRAGGGGFSLFTTTRTVVRTNPSVSSRMFALVVGETTRAEIDAWLGEPSETTSVGDIELRRYVSSERTTTRRTLLGVIPVGSGSSSRTEEGFVLIRGDVLVRTSEQPSDDPAVEAALEAALAARVRSIAPGAGEDAR